MAVATVCNNLEAVRGLTQETASGRGECIELEGCGALGYLCRYVG